MRATNMKNTICISRLLLLLVLALLLTATAQAADPGITGPTFNLKAPEAYINQPDGAAIYSWGYGCNGNPFGFERATTTTPFCTNVHVPGPTLIVTEGESVS